VSADNPPRRRVRLTVTVEADTFAGAAEGIVRYVEDLERWTRAGRIDRDAPGLSSGYRTSSAGHACYTLNVAADVPVGDEYRERLRQWADEVRTQSKDEEGA
jgi:hypothetical protein